MKRAALFLCSVLFLPIPMGSAKAGPSVAVSIAPLHSLVAGLMEGVGEPALVFAGAPKQRLRDLDRAEIETLAGADMVIWVGPDLEAAIAEARLVDPGLARRSLTLSSTLPMFGFRHGTGWGEARLGEDGLPDRNMAFWLDPRVAKVAVGRITPHLVRLDPDNAETYLDNEIRLKKRLTEFETGLRGLVDGTGGKFLVADDRLRYLENRFGFRASGRVGGGPAAGCHVATAPSASVPDGVREVVVDAVGRDFRAGPELYFGVVEAGVRAIADCLGGQQLAETLPGAPDSSK